jgi:hypothetical protein
MTPPKITTYSTDENGQTFWFIKHNYYVHDVPGAPADGPYATVEEAQAAAGVLQDALQAAGGYDGGGISDPATHPREGRSITDV